MPFTQTSCPGCLSDDTMIRVNDCRNSWHPAQAFPLPEGKNHMRRTCGSHCGVKDNMSGHCDCPACHNGQREAEGLKELTSTIGLSVTGIKPT